MAFITNGYYDKGDAVKIEFELLNKIVVLCGVVNHCGYNRENDISFVRIKFIEPDIKMISAVRSFIYNINREQDIINNNSKNVENEEKIDNNKDEDSEDDVLEVEYLPEDHSISI